MLIRGAAANQQHNFQRDFYFNLHFKNTELLLAHYIALKKKTQHYNSL